MPMGARLIHPDVHTPQISKFICIIWLITPPLCPSLFPKAQEQCLQCLGARQLFLPLLRKQAVYAKCELQSVGFP